MREQPESDDLHTRMCHVAAKAIALYAEGLLSVEELTERMLEDWARLSGGEEIAGHAVLMRIAQRVCSYELYQAWRSSERRELAYINLYRYLRWSLGQTSYGSILQRQMHAVEDVLNRTLEILHTEVVYKEQAGPDDPAAFLKWTQTIAIRQARLYVQRDQRDSHLSLEGQRELFAEKLVDREENDPVEQVLLGELRQILGESIMSMGNKKYQQVLLYSYFIEIDEKELAQRLQVRVTDIYLWRHRALKALRNRPEVMKALRSLRC